MTASYRLLRRLSSLLLAAFSAARLASEVIPVLAPERARLGTMVLLLCALRFGFLLFDWARGARKWQQVIAPSIVLLALVAAFGGHLSQWLVKIAAALAELGVLGVVISVALKRDKADSRPFEARLLDALQSFFPALVARFVVAEMMIVRAAAMGLFRRVPKPAGGFGYTETSAFRILPLLLLSGTPPDLILSEVVLKKLHLATMLWTVALTGSHFYAVMWVYGVLVTMRMRPHIIAGSNLCLHKGIFASVTVPLNAIAAVHVLPPGRRKGKDRGDLTLSGAAKLALELRAPVRVTRWFRPGVEPVSRVTVSADDPQALSCAIEAAR